MISRDSKPIPCEECGLPTLHVARLVSGDGTLLGQTKGTTWTDAAAGHSRKHVYRVRAVDLAGRSI